MKYMTFNSSCAYAGLANLLSFHGVDTEDREIALRMRLPWLFSCEDGRYLSGPMLQGARWFDLYLNPLGFSLLECRAGREDVFAFLQAGGPAMLGLRVSKENKHAVIYTGCKGNELQFLNNKREDGPEPDTLSLTEDELVSRLDESVIIGRLGQTAPARTSFLPYLKESLRVVDRLTEDIFDFCITEQSIAAIEKSMDSLFRAVLVDGVTMLELLGETVFSEMLREVRGQFLGVVRAGHSERLEDVLDMRKLNGAIAYFGHLIRERIKEDSI